MTQPVQGGQIDANNTPMINTWIAGVLPHIPLQLGQSYELMFDIGPRRTEAIAAEHFDTAQIFARLPPEINQVEVLVVLETDDFTIAGDYQAPLIVTRAGTARNHVMFLITPLRNGPGVIKVLLCANNRVFQKMTITLHVGAAAGSVAQDVRAVGLRMASGVARTTSAHRSLGIEVEPHERTYRIKLRDRFLLQGGLNLSLDKLDQLVARARATLREVVYTQLDGGYVYHGLDVSIAPEIYAMSLRTLAVLGSYLYQELFVNTADADARALGAWLRQVSQQSSLEIAIDAPSFIFPWALLYDRPLIDPDTIDPEGFWGFRHIIQYLPQFRVAPVDLVETIAVVGDLRLAFVVNTKIDQELARQGMPPVIAPHQAALERLQGVRLSIHPNRQDLYALLRDSADPPQLIYLYCHADSKVPGDMCDVANLLRRDLMNPLPQELAIARSATELDVDSSAVQLSDGTVRLIDLKIFAPIEQTLMQAPRGLATIPSFWGHRT